MELLKNCLRFIVFQVLFGGSLSLQQQRDTVVSRVVDAISIMQQCNLQFLYFYIFIFFIFYFPNSHHYNDVENTNTSCTWVYVDAYPTSPCGKIVAVFAMLCSVLVIAFPVSIFSELWQKELHAMGELKNLYNESDDDDNDDEGMSFQSSSKEDDDEEEEEEEEVAQVPVQFVSTTSSHNFHESENDYNLDTTMSFTSLVQQTHDDMSHNSGGSLVKTGLDEQEDNDLSHSVSDSSSPVEFTAQDAADLRLYVESIEESQQKIRKILSKLEASRKF